jgi:xanthine/uracil/vitamin C permease (AzgA family)
MIARTETSPTVLRLAAAAAYASAVVPPIGLVFLVALYISFGVGARSQGLVFGWINDVLAVVTGLLMLPIAVAVHVLLRERAPQRSRLALIVGIGANVAIVILQSLLVVGSLTFERGPGRRDVRRLPVLGRLVGPASPPTVRGASLTTGLSVSGSLQLGAPAGSGFRPARRRSV